MKITVIAVNFTEVCYCIVQFAIRQHYFMGWLAAEHATMIIQFITVHTVSPGPDELTLVCAMPKYVSKQ